MKSSEVTPTHLTISEKIRPFDVEFLEDIAGEKWNGDCILYAFNAGSNLILENFWIKFLFKSISLFQLISLSFARWLIKQFEIAYT